ncbi:MAG TPA: hypothetical protein VHY84_12030 [Bryobacteraceae bacterium]|jgi:hypothetical protein|nr:hypothetical protein [Bryobacteraceae bacterium]
MSRLFVFILATASVALNAAQSHDFKTGKLLDIGSSERVLEGTVYRSALFTVQIEDIIYTARGDRIRRGSGDVGKGLIVGDPVQVAIDGERLIFLLPNGKEMKTTITKRARAQTAP